VQVTCPVSSLLFTIPKFGTWQRYIFSDVEPITAMMDSPSSFIFETIPFHLKHYLLFKTKHFVFSKARLSIRKLFNKTGNQGLVINSKEGMQQLFITQLLSPNASFQVIKSLNSKKGKYTGACLVL
jgi:hypothetical protein